MSTIKRDPRPAEIPPEWPDVSVDHQAIDQAFEELGDDAPLTKVLARAQEIKEDLLLKARPVQ